MQEEAPMDMMPQEMEGEQEYGLEQSSGAKQMDDELLPNNQMAFNPIQKVNVLGKQKVPGLALGGLGIGGQADQDHASKAPGPPGLGGLGLDLSQLKKN